MPRPAKERDREISIRASRYGPMAASARSATAIRQRARRHLRISLDLTQSQFFRRSRIWRSRTREVQILSDPARYARAPDVFGISGSGVARLRAAGSQPGNRSLYSTFICQAGARNSQSPVDDEEDRDRTSMLSRLPESLVNIDQILKKSNLAGSPSKLTSRPLRPWSQIALHNLASDGQNRTDFSGLAIEDGCGGR